MKRTYLATALLLCTTGCDPYLETTDSHSPLQLPQRDYVLVLAVDVSGSFLAEMFGPDGRAYEFTMNAANRLFQDRMGHHDSILIAQLSANDRPLLWEGTPRQLRERFGAADVLRQFIEQRSNPHGSRLYAGTAETLDYVRRLPGVADRDTTVCVLVLSDMIDTSHTSPEDKERMTESLHKFKDLDASVGYYFVDIGQLDTVRQCLLDAGLDERYIESGIVQDPPLPSFVN